ncbi:MAG: thiamine phosphate synthase [Candidatus Omnitrophica bacterium]|nr:thiamine phosphate synthase [Candidatus Omnitrophota bacterium]
MRIKGYYFITDAGLSSAGNISDVKNALAAGVKIVQYRNKAGSSRQMYKEALTIKALCRKAGAIFIVNDRIDIALAVKADGVHLGTDDMPYGQARRLLGKAAVIGLTIHNIKEGKETQRLGADYIGVSPIFATGTKRDAGRPIGVSGLREISKAVKMPIAAIGGITLDNGREAVMAGADMLCAISAVVTKKDVKREIKKFQEFFT